MAVEFTTTNREQIQEIAAFLQRCLHAAPDAPVLHLPFLIWKYYEPGPAWPGSRSYVLSDGQQILAHAAIWPLQLRLNGAVRSGIGFSDWVASEQYHDAGFLLLQKLLKLAPFTLVIGSAESAKPDIPDIGFQPWADLSVYARVLRPFRQLRTRPSHLGWKEPVRVLRNLSWSWKPLRKSEKWTVQESAPNVYALAVAQEQPGSVHSIDFLRFMSRCPAIPIRFFSLQEASRLRGYAVVSVVGGQARIAALRIASENPEHWQGAVAALTKTLECDPSICEVTVLSSTPLLEHALRVNGYVLQERRPLMVFDAEQQLASQPVPQIGMLEDVSFLDLLRQPYLT